MANAMNKVRSDMAQRFVDALSQGQLPWRACWRQQRPVNMTTGKLYRGVNALYLSYIADELGYADPRWCTYKQAQEKGWQVRKGEKSARVEYWAYYDRKQKKLLSWEDARRCLAADPNYMENLQLSCRVYSVFNACQMDGVPELLQGTTDIGTVRAQRDTLLLNMNVGYREQGDRAYYSSNDDQVTLPPEAAFDDTYSYMATFLHECGHASGHPSRLCRDMSGWHGTPAYAREELRAEIASAFTVQALGLELSDAQMEWHMEQHIAYVQSWAGVLQKNPEELFRAIKAAEEISDYLIEKGEFSLEHSSEKLDPVASKPVTLIGPNDNSKIIPWGITPHRRAAHDLTSPAELLAAAQHYPLLTREQLSEVSCGIRDRLTGEQLAVFAKPEFTPLQMNALRYALKEDLPSSAISLIANPNFDSIKMDIIRSGFVAGMTHDQVLTFAKPELSAHEMMDIYQQILAPQRSASSMPTDPVLDNGAEPDFEP